MGQLSRILFAATFAFAQFAQAKIIEIQSFTESLPALESASLVVFDIDNTLARPAQTLGSDQWYGSRVEVWKKQGLSRDEVIEKSIAEWVEVQKKTKVQITEQAVAVILQNLKRRGIPAMALTARPIELAEVSAQQLSSIGISFATGNPYGQELQLGSENPALYRNGILFVGPKNNKGEILRTFLEKIRKDVKNLVFFDDKKHHVDSLETVFTGISINYLGFRYAFLDKWVASFDAKLSEVQYAEFKLSGKLLSDEEAAQKIK